MIINTNTPKHKLDKKTYFSLDVSSEGNLIALIQNTGNINPKITPMILTIKIIP